MTDHATRGDEVDNTDQRAKGPAVRTPVTDTAAYDVDGGVVFYDVDNPLAWIEAEGAVDVERMA